MLYELAVLRVLTPYWPTPDRYARLGSAGDASVLITTSSLEHADLLAHHVAYASTVGRLRSAWRVALAPHLAGAPAPTLALEPADPQASLDTLTHDLERLADGLARSVRRLARARLFQLDPLASGGPALELSGREREVLDLFLAGLSTPTIARRLFISPHTVRNHLKHVCSKLEVGSQRQLRELFAASME